MAKLSLSVNKKQDDYDEYVYTVDVYNPKLKQKVIRKEHKNYKIDFEQEIETESGITLLNINGDTKLIIEYEDACWPEHLDDFYTRKYIHPSFPYFPYEKVNGEIQNTIAIEDILLYSKFITFYTSSGNKIFSVCKDETTRIMLKENTFIVRTFDYSENYFKVTDVIYNYDGKILSKKFKERYKLNVTVENNYEEDMSK